MIAIALACGAVIVLAAAYAVGGEAGLFALACLAAIAALASARLRIAAPRRPPPGGEPPEAVPNAEYADYRAASRALHEAGVSPRHFDLVTRPLLQRLLAALLASRRREDLAADPAAGRAALGAELWPLLDPARPASGDSRGPGAGPQVLTEIIDRLEGL